MKSFTFKDVSSNSLGIVVQNMPSVPRAEKQIESLQILGKNGNLHIDNNCYNSIDYTIECICTDKESIDSINSTFQGIGKLVLSDYSDRYWEATIKNQVSYETYLTYLDSFPLIFELNPIAKSINNTEVEFTETSTFSVGGNVEVSPTITVSGTGRITLNGKNIDILESGITINCELMQCFSNIVAKNDKVILDEFPKLRVGANNIILGNGITKVVIDYRKGWI